MLRYAVIARSVLQSVANFESSDCQWQSHNVNTRRGNPLRRCANVTTSNQNAGSTGGLPRQCLAPQGCASEQPMRQHRLLASRSALARNDMLLFWCANNIVNTNFSPHSAVQTMPFHKNEALYRGFFDVFPNRFLQCFRVC